MNPNILWWRSSLKGQTTRRWAFYTLGAYMCAMDTGRMHGPLTRRDDLHARRRAARAVLTGHRCHT